MARVRRIFSMRELSCTDSDAGTLLLVLVFPQSRANSEVTPPISQEEERPRKRPQVTGNTKLERRFSGVVPIKRRIIASHCTLYLIFKQHPLLFICFCLLKRFLNTRAGLVPFCRADLLTRTGGSDGLKTETSCGAIPQQPTA